MASVYEKYYERQPRAAKVIIVAGVGLLGYTIYKAIQKAQDEKKAKKAAEAAAGEAAGYIAQGIQPSYADSEYHSMVNALVQAMTGCGTDEDTIFEVFRRMHNPVDIRKLISAFGIQYYEPCAATSPISYLRWQLDDKAFGGDLATWLRFDLSGHDIATINQILSEGETDFQF